MKTDLFNHSCTFLAAGSEIADQDSLDGQLPSNRHSAVGHDPPGRPISPPAPPPGGPEPPPNFEKAPAKVKKHRRFHKDQSQESGESSEDVEQKLSSSNSHLSKASGGGANTVTTNASKISVRKQSGVSYNGQIFQFTWGQEFLKKDLSS